MTNWTNHPAVGYLPQIFDENDPRTAQEQANTNYPYGGGWNSFKGFTLSGEGHFATLNYPGDPPTHELARAPFRDQTLILFEHAWVAIVSADGVLEDVARMD